MVDGDGVGDILQQHGLAGTGRRHDQTTLALADRSRQVHHPHGEIIRLGLEHNTLFRIQGRQVVEQGLVPSHRRVFEVDFRHLEQRKVTFPFFGRPNLTGHRIAGT